MLIMEDGSITGTIGGGCVESEVMQKALLMMRKGEPVFQLCKVDMTADERRRGRNGMRRRRRSDA